MDKKVENALVEMYKSDWKNKQSTARRATYAKRAQKYGLTVSKIAETTKALQGSQQLVNPIKNVEPAKTTKPELTPFVDLFQRGELTLEDLLKIAQKAENAPKTGVFDKETGLIDSDAHNWGFLGDIHAPFDDPRYRDFVFESFHKYKVDKQVAVGDVVDNSALSYHESDPELFGAKEELERAKASLRLYHDEYPKMVVCLGNHDRLHKRKATTAGLPGDWIRPIAEVLGLPGWEFVVEFETSKFIVGHGDDGANMKNKIIGGKSYWQGHYHSKSSLTWYEGGSVYAAQLGFGGDKKSRAFQYAGKGAKRNINSLGMLIEGDPMILVMKPNKVYGKYFQSK